MAVVACQDMLRLPLLLHNLGGKGNDSVSATFDVYVERFELCVETNDIAHAKKAKLFLTAIGEQAYATLRSTLLKKTPSEATYKEIVTELRKHYAPKRSVVAERYQFHRRIQRDDESINEFLVPLKSLASYCKFGSFLEEALRDRFIAGLTNNSIRCRLLAMEDSEATLSRVCELAEAMEAAERQAREMYGASTTDDAEGNGSCDNCKIMLSCTTPSRCGVYGLIHGLDNGGLIYPRPENVIVCKIICDFVVAVLKDSQVRKHGSLGLLL
ncbi:uncharacterized protein LOC135384639 [Ornithodoros turicata]|uniref:uncharacterized protein LOC135384639 n=1 Tax=Ornithodoros turicata TaxID=34597 RepID=UPI003139277B